MLQQTGSTFLLTIIYKTRILLRAIILNIVDYLEEIIMGNTDTLFTYENYSNLKLEIFEPKDTNSQMVSLTDPETGVVGRTIVANKSIAHLESIKAYTATKISRSPKTFQEIYLDLLPKKEEAEQGFAKIVTGGGHSEYGHNSPAESATLFLYLENVPDLYATLFYYLYSLYTGQQASSRYQLLDQLKAVRADYFDPRLAHLNQDFEEYQKLSQRLYLEWYERLLPAFSNYFDIDIGNRGLKSRVLDTARSFLLGGLSNKTSFSYLTSARAWSDLLGDLKARYDPKLERLAQQIEFLFAPPEDVDTGEYIADAPDLFRHTEEAWQLPLTLENCANFIDQIVAEKETELEVLSPVHTTSQYVHYLPDLKSEEVLMAKFLMVAMPNQFCLSKGIEFVRALSIEEQKALSAIVFEHFHHHSQMPDWSKFKPHTFVIEGALADMRDIFRHRPWARLSKLLSSTDHSNMWDNGYCYPLYLDIPEMAELKQEFLADLDLLFDEGEKLSKKILEVGLEFMYILPQLAPFAYNMMVILQGDEKDGSYLSCLRSMPGGHINYRLIAWLIAHLIATLKPLLSGLELPTKPFISSREEFISRK